MAIESSKIKAWQMIDYFIHPCLHESSDFFYRSRVIILILIAGIAVPVIASCTLLLISPPDQTFDVAIAISLAGILPQLGVLYVLKKYGNYSMCSLLLIVQAFIGIIATTVVTGGPFDSPVIQLIGICCLMAFYLGGRRWGVIMTILTLLTLVTLIAMQMSGFNFPSVTHPTFRSFSMAFLMPINFGIVMMFAIAYEITFFLVKKEHDNEHEKFLQWARVDPLTGLANRRIFDETLTARIDLYGKLIPIRSFGLCYLDLNKFKPINDQFGHDVGDEVLNLISMRLRSALRGADFIGRHGGDEFLLLLDSVNDNIAAAALLKRFLDLINEPIQTSVGELIVDGSLGLAIYPQHGSDMVSLQKAADCAMYQAKRTQSGFAVYCAAHAF